MRITGNDLINIRKKFNLNREDFSIFADVDISHLIFFEKHHNKIIFDPKLFVFLAHMIYVPFRLFSLDYTLEFATTRKYQNLALKYNKVVSAHHRLLSYKKVQVVRIISLKKELLMETQKFKVE